MKRKKRLLAAGCFLVLFIALTALVSTVDVAPIGPAGTSVGFSRVNGAVHDSLGFNPAWYRVTQWLGYISILTAVCIAAAGLIQAIRRKGLLRADRELIMLGCIYAAVAVLYILFEKVIINYRPVIMPDSTEPEASFPSTHTMLSCVVMGTALMLTGRYIRSAALRRAAQAGCALVLALTVIGRLLSGVHWLTDIAGGLLISAALLALYAGIREPAGQ